MAATFNRYTSLRKFNRFQVLSQIKEINDKVHHINRIC